MEGYFSPASLRLRDDQWEIPHWCQVCRHTAAHPCNGPWFVSKKILLALGARGMPGMTFCTKIIKINRPSIDNLKLVHNQLVWRGNESVLRGLQIRKRTGFAG